MIVKLRQKSQLTIPAECIKALSLKVGDKLEVTIENGTILFTPISTYSPKYVKALNEEAIESKQKVSSGHQKTFKSVDELIKNLEKN